jgi:uncharacterized protein
MNFEDIISNAIKEAMKAKDKVRLDTLRGIKKELIEARTAKGAAPELDEQAIVKMLQKMVKQRQDAAAIYQSQGRADLAESELAECTVITDFLPKQLSLEELEKEVQLIISETGATSITDLGKVMGIASKKVAGRSDGKTISEVVRKLLQ